MTKSPPTLELELDGLIRLSGLDLESAASRDAAQRAFESLGSMVEAGSVGFPALADGQDVVDSALKYASSLPDQVDTLVVIGIGGSSLGPQALYSALGRPYDVLLPRTAAAPRRLFFPDNSDPVTFAGLLDVVDLERTVFNIVTKSGSTAETAAQTVVLVERLRERLGDSTADHLVVTTDPQRGDLRALAERMGLAAFPIPANVGGRFSVLSAVGLVPAAVAGFDVRGLLQGAKRMRDAIESAGASVTANPALLLAAALHAHDRDCKRPIVVMMPYADALVDCAAWWRQLWAESLGKATDKTGRAVHVGPTPVAFRGATDQHSQLQLYAEGPDDKVYLTLHAGRDVDVDIPSSPLGDLEAYGYLVGKSMGALLDAELAGTDASLRARGRAVGGIELADTSAPSLGAFFMLWQYATAYAGSYYGVDPFDQPGVEEAKRNAYGALGRKGYSLPAAVSGDRLRHRFVLP